MTNGEEWKHRGITAETVTTV